MNGKAIVKIASMLGAGFTAGFFFSKKYYENHYYNMVEDIYNECYRQVETELRAEAEVKNTKQKATNNVVGDFNGGSKRVSSKINEALTIPYRAYDKPNLDQIAKDRLGISISEVTGQPEMSDQDFFGDEAMEDETSVEDEIEADRGMVEDDDGDSDRLNRYITEKEFFGSNQHFNKADIFYYRQDNVFTGEDDQVIGSDEGIFDSETVDIDRRLQQQNIVYIRCYRLGTDFQIFCLNSAYHDIVAETPKERERRITKRKMRD